MRTCGRNHTPRVPGFPHPAGTAASQTPSQPLGRTLQPYHPRSLRPRPTPSIDIGSGRVIECVAKPCWVDCTMSTGWRTSPHERGHSYCAPHPFTSVADLKRAGVSASTIDKISRTVTVSPQPVAPAPQPRAAQNHHPRAPQSEVSRPAPSPTAAVPQQGGNGQVWVNLDSKLYQYQGDRYYGKTKNGKYMSEQEAIQAGYRASKTGPKKEK
jgi:hypothetical protein